MDRRRKPLRPNALDLWNLAGRLLLRQEWTAKGGPRGKTLRIKIGPAAMSASMPCRLKADEQRITHASRTDSLRCISNVARPYTIPERIKAMT